MVWVYQPDIPLDKLKSKYSGPDSKYLNLDGLVVHYQDQGSGTPMVLLHGTAASLHTWDGWAKELRPHLRVMRMDLPPFAPSGPSNTKAYYIQYY